MKTFANLMWALLGGFVAALLWVLFGTILCISVIGFPFGIQCFKMAGLNLAPFGKNVEMHMASHMFANVFWMIFFGWEIALVNTVTGLIFAVSIIGIPFALQCFKIAALALYPFGATVSEGAGDQSRSTAFQAA